MDSIRDEILTAVTGTKQHGNISFDLPKLLSLPLLSSVFAETLRLRMSATPTRQLRTDLEVDGYLLKAALVMLPSWLAHTDTKWSTEEHPATTFWAERLQSDHGGGDSVTSSQSKPGRYFPSKVEVRCVQAVSLQNKRF
jgi:cytochrome P450